MPDRPDPSSPTDVSSPPRSASPTSRAAFLGGLLAFIGLVALSVIGVGHSRAIEGAANAQYWIVTAAVACAFGFVAISLARTPARSRAGEAARRAALPVAALCLVVFVWEAFAIGSGALPGPFELGWSAWKG